MAVKKAKKKSAAKKKATTKKKVAVKKPAAKKKPASKKKATTKKKVAVKKAAAKKKPAAKKPAVHAPAAPAPVKIPVPTMGAVLGAMFAHDATALAQALMGVDFERVARYLLTYDWSTGHWTRMDWELVLGKLDADVVATARAALPGARAAGDLRKFARALRAVDWKKLVHGAPLDEMAWFGQVVELVVSLYNHEKKEVVCPSCAYPYRDVFGRLFHMEREITGRVVPMLCPYEGVGQHCPPDLAADSWTRLDDLTGQDGRAVSTAGLGDRTVTAPKIAFDLSQIPEGGGCVAMTDEERDRIHKQHAGRVPAEPASSDGEIIVTLAGFRALDEVQVVASGFYTEGDGPKKPMVLEWELNELNSEVTFRPFDADGNAVVGENQFITIDWIATTR